MAEETYFVSTIPRDMALTKQFPEYESSMTTSPPTVGIPRQFP